MGLIGRSLGSLINFSPALDPDAINFLSAAGLIGDPAWQPAINSLVLNLKTGIVNQTNVWNLFTAIYPFAGLTQTTQSVNLRNPATFPVQYVGSGTYSHTINGFRHLTHTVFTSFAHSGVIPSTHLPTNNTHLAVLVTENPANEANTGTVGADRALGIRLRRTGFTNFWQNDITTGVINVDIPDTELRHFFLGSRLSSSNQRAYINGALSGVNTVTAPNGTLTAPLALSGLTNLPPSTSVTAPITQRLGFWSCGSGFNDQEVADYRAAIRAYCIAIGRFSGF